MSSTAARKKYGSGAKQSRNSHHDLAETIGEKAAGREYSAIRCQNLLGISEVKKVTHLQGICLRAGEFLNLALGS